MPLWKIYHLDPSTPHNFRVGQRVVRGMPLGRTYTNQFWRNSSGGLTRTHLHVGQMSRAGALLDPMRPGGIEPGSLTGGVVPGASGSSGLPTQKLSSKAIRSGLAPVTTRLRKHSSTVARPIA